MESAQDHCVHLDETEPEESPRAGIGHGTFFLEDTSMPRHSSLLRLSTSEWFILLTIILVAALLRFYQLDSLPPGLHVDEAGEGLDALEMLRKGFRVFCATQGGREPLFAYLLAVLFSIWGPQVIVLRGAGALAGTVAVGVAYLLVREMFKTVVPNHVRWLTAMTALGMVVGMYGATSGQRLRILDTPDDRLILPAQIEVGP